MRHRYGSICFHGTVFITGETNTRWIFCGRLRFVRHDVRGGGGVLYHAVSILYCDATPVVYCDDRFHMVCLTVGQLCISSIHSIHLSGHPIRSHDRITTVFTPLGERQLQSIRRLHPRVHSSPRRLSGIESSRRNVVGRRTVCMLHRAFMGVPRIHRHTARNCRIRSSTHDGTAGHEFTN